jgi:hypothetical protein
MWQLARSFTELKFCTDSKSLLGDLVKRYPQARPLIRRQGRDEAHRQAAEVRLQQLIAPAPVLSSARGRRRQEGDGLRGAGRGDAGRGASAAAGASAARPASAAGANAAAGGKRRPPSKRRRPSKRRLRSTRRRLRCPVRRS